MKRTIALLSIIGLGLSLSAPVFAAKHHESRVDVRQERQWDRIEQGRESGELTRREFRRLKKEQRQIALLERTFLEDGRLSRLERRLLKAKQDEASKNIFRLKHNERAVGRQRADDHRHADRVRWQR
ncbi:MAG: hypothetical protein KDH88_12600 [Chromatiales bacterium]|nr:hypothetical protein [Chromatiales bacterium]